MLSCAVLSAARSAAPWRCFCLLSPLLAGAAGQQALLACWPADADPCNTCFGVQLSERAQQVCEIMDAVVALDIVAARAQHALWLQASRPGFVGAAGSPALQGLSALHTPLAQHPVLMQPALPPLPTAPSAEDHRWGTGPCAVNVVCVGLVALGQEEGRLARAGTCCCGHPAGARSSHLQRRAITAP